MQGSKSERLYLAQINYETDELNYAIKRSDESLISLVKGADSRYNINLQGAINYSGTIAGKHDVAGMFPVQRDNWESTCGEIPLIGVCIAALATDRYDNRYWSSGQISINISEQLEH